MVKNIIFVLLLLGATLSTGCTQTLDNEELVATREYCDQFTTENTCDLESCEWAFPVGCVDPETNCGAGFIPEKRCVPKGHGFEST